jgi:hypothetical protein
MSHISYQPELQAIYNLRRASNHRKSLCSGYAQYEQRKAQWIVDNPTASQAEYDRAIQRLARECGV